MDNYPSNVQANTGRAIMANVFAVAVRHGIVNLNPAKEISANPVVTRDRILTDAEFQAIYAKAAPHIQILMDIGYLTGSRIQDILDIRLQDISHAGLFIQQGKTKKKMLFIPSPALDDAIARARTLPRPVRGMHLICDHSGKAYPYGTFWNHWTAATAAAGIENAHFHDIRAKAATDAKDMGLDYQKLLGHTTQAMSDKYIRTKSIQKVASL
jgi:integrase